MAGPIQSSEDFDYEFTPNTYEEEFFLSPAFYVVFVIVFLIVAFIVIVIYFLWRTGRCRGSKCGENDSDVESRGRGGGGGGVGRGGGRGREGGERGGGSRGSSSEPLRLIVVSRSRRGTEAEVLAVEETRIQAQGREKDLKIASQIKIHPQGTDADLKRAPFLITDGTKEEIARLLFIENSETLDSTPWRAFMSTDKREFDRIYPSIEKEAKILTLKSRSLNARSTPAVTNCILESPSEERNSTRASTCRSASSFFTRGNADDITDKCIGGDLGTNLSSSQNASSASSIAATAEVSPTSSATTVSQSDRKFAASSTSRPEVPDTASNQRRKLSMQQFQASKPKHLDLEDENIAY